MKRCSTCGRLTKEYAEFPCPHCSEKTVRCHHCREIRNPYKCKCGNFEGP
ncbi:RNA-binding protein [Candidatus Micrarchaeota archaeon]|nr:RNA-binding protein [Candidatus Micrarchaeota archaeon]